LLLEQPGIVAGSTALLVKIDDLNGLEDERDVAGIGEADAIFVPVGVAFP